MDVLARIDDYLTERDWRVRENSNMAFSLQGLNQQLSGAASAAYWLERVYMPAIREAHVGGDFHLHDLNSLSVYCMGWDLEDLLVRKTYLNFISGRDPSEPGSHLLSNVGVWARESRPMCSREGLPSLYPGLACTD